MENQNSNEPKFLGMKRDALIAAGAVFAPTLTVLVAVVALFAVTNANISRLNDTVTNLAAQGAAHGAAIEALHSDLRDLDDDVRDLDDDVDALSEDVLELKIESVRTNNRLDSIETRLDSVETSLGSVETRLDSLERGQTELKDHVDALRPIQPADQ